MDDLEQDEDGRSAQWVSISKWQTRRQRKLITGVILLIALLLPVTAVLLAITDAYPGYVCGSWWYRLIVMLILGIQRISGYL